MSFPSTSVTKKQVVETGVLLVTGCLLTGLYREETGWFRAALLGAGLVLLVPKVFVPVAILWFAFSRGLSSLMSRVLLSTLFVVLVVPVAWLRKTFGWNALRTKSFRKSTGSVFVDRNHTFSREDLQHPF